MLDNEECRRLAATARVARLATVRADGRVDLVPIVFSFVRATLVFAIDHKPKATRRLQRLANIEANREVTVLFDHYDDDWAQLWWVRLRGDAAAVSGDQAESALDSLQARYDQYRDARPAGPVVAITPSEWTGWRAAPR